MAGFGCRLAPGARGIHAYSETLGANSARKYAMTGWSRGYLLRAYGFGRRPLLLARAVAVEGAICAGQILLQRTAQGARARLRGWRDGRQVARRSIPDDGLLDISARDALALRRQRHRD